MTSQSALQLRLLDEKVSGVTLVDWAAWAASTTFSSTGLGFGYDTAEVDAFRSAVRDTFLGGAVFWVSHTPGEIRWRPREKFSTHRRGYDKKEVAAFLEAAGLRLAAIEATDGPDGPLVSGATLVGWAEWADSTTFSKARWRLGYEPKPVDAFREKIRDTFLGARRSPVRADKVRAASSSPRPTTLAMTRSRLPRSSMPPASGWPRWRPRTGHQDTRLQPRPTASAGADLVVTDLSGCCDLLGVMLATTEAAKGWNHRQLSYPAGCS
jgi:hypothetical protein